MTLAGATPARPQVALSFARAPDGRTFLARRFATYPFFCASPFHLDAAPSGMLTAILQSASGGLYEGERLALSVDAGAGAAAHVTTQGATVAHPMPGGGEARHAVLIRAAAGSLVEYLPDPLILLPGASVSAELDVLAEDGATAIFGDAFLHHDPDGRGRPFRRLASRIALGRPGQAPAAVERFDVSGAEAEAARRPLYPDAGAAQGSLWVWAPHPANELATALRCALGGVPGLYAGASTLPGETGAVARVLAQDALALAAGFRAGWRALRLLLTGSPPNDRRKSGWL